MPNMLQLKIIILGAAKLFIWRRVIVKPTMKLMHLHYLIQILFEWQNSHLHKFEKPFVETPYDSENPENNRGYCLGSYGGLDERKTLKQFFKEPRDQLIYEYDFGDSWEHLIELEKIVPKDKKETYPLCVTGRSMAPFDDVGGIGGFYDFLDALEDKDHPEHDNFKEWLVDRYGFTDLAKRNFNKKRLNKAIKDNMELLS